MQSALPQRKMMFMFLAALPSALFVIPAVGFGVPMHGYMILLDQIALAAVAAAAWGEFSALPIHRRQFKMGNFIAFCVAFTLLLCLILIMPGVLRGSMQATPLNELPVFLGSDSVNYFHDADRLQTRILIGVWIMLLALKALFLYLWFDVKKMAWYWLFIVALPGIMILQTNNCVFNRGYCLNVDSGTELRDAVSDFIGRSVR